MDTMHDIPEILSRDIPRFAFALLAALAGIAHADKAPEQHPQLARIQGALVERQLCLIQKDAARRASCLDDLLTQTLLRWDQDAKKVEEMTAAAAAAPSSQHEPIDAWEPLVRSGLGRMAEQLKDPSSVQYRSLRLFGGDSTDAPQAICGEVNARNAYGGYVGYRRFFFEFQTAASHIEQDRGAAMLTLWGDFCSKRPRGEVELSPSGRLAITRFSRTDAP